MNAPAMSGTISVKSSLLFRIIDDLSRHRELDDPESELLEQLLTVKEAHARHSFKWTAQDNLELLQAAARRGGIKAFAATKGISCNSAYVQLGVVRKSLNCAERGAKGKG